MDARIVPIGDTRHREIRFVIKFHRRGRGAGSARFARRIGMSQRFENQIDMLLGDRKSTRLNSSHGYISYAVFCLKKKKNTNHAMRLNSIEQANREETLLTSCHMYYRCAAMSIYSVHIPSCLLCGTFVCADTIVAF